VRASERERGEGEKTFFLLFFSRAVNSFFSFFFFLSFFLLSSFFLSFFLLSSFIYKTPNNTTPHSLIWRGGASPGREQQKNATTKKVSIF